MLDRIPERLRTAAEGVERATQMMADAKSKRNQDAGDVGASYSGLKKEQTVEWQAADMIERNEEHYQAAMATNEKHRKLWVEACQQRDRMRAALVQVNDVCTDNAPDSCNHKMALQFVRDVAVKAIT